MKSQIIQLLKVLFLADAGGAGAIVVAIVVHGSNVFERKIATLKQAKSVIVGLAYGAMFVLLTLLVSLLSGTGGFPAKVFQKNFLDGLFLGVGLALGIEAGESLLHSLEHHAMQHRALRAFCGNW
jgi:hypothetical protein